MDMAARFTTTTKDIGLLWQLYQDDQLQLSAEFQRNAVWTRAAKAYLIDSILLEVPIPVLYFQRSVSAQTNRLDYTVVDGQQRLNAVFQFMENRFSLTESNPSSPWYRKRWKTLTEDERTAILSYDLVVQELSGYSADKVREMFQRMNRYVVALNPQERRHASETGAFKRMVERLGERAFWVDFRVVTPNAKRRMKNDELVAELLILLNEGPQDKKESVDFYYQEFVESFVDGEDLEEELSSILDYLASSYPELAKSPLRKPANIYALVGALSEMKAEGENWPLAAEIASRLDDFSRDLSGAENRSDRATDYFLAQSRQTDNIRPRRTRIDILRSVISGES